MKFIPLEDDSWLNINFVKRFYITEAEAPEKEDGSDSHTLCVITTRLHEDEAEIVSTGTEEECYQKLKRILNHDSGT